MCLHQWCWCPADQSGNNHDNVRIKYCVREPQLSKPSLQHIKKVKREFLYSMMISDPSPPPVIHILNSAELSAIWLSGAVRCHVHTWITMKGKWRQQVTALLKYILLIVSCWLHFFFIASLAWTAVDVVETMLAQNKSFYKTMHKYSSGCSLYNEADKVAANTPDRTKAQQCVLLLVVDDDVTTRLSINYLRKKIVNKMKFKSVRGV